MLSSPWLWVAGLLVAALCLFRRRRLRALHGAAAWCPPSLRGDAPDLSSDYDVIVVGAGVAGPAVAVGLARQGRRVLVLEADLSRPETVIGELLMPGGQRSLRALGLSGAVPDATDVATKVWGMTMFYKDTTLPLPFPDDLKAVTFEHGDFVMGLRREMRAAAAALDATAAAGVPGGSITIVEAAVKSLIADPTGSVVHGVNYAPRRQDGPGFEDEQQAATARLVVLADGVNSRFTNVVSTARLDVPAPVWIARRVFTSLASKERLGGSADAVAEAASILPGTGRVLQQRHIFMHLTEMQLDRSCIYFNVSGQAPALWYPLRGSAGTVWRVGATYLGEAPARVSNAAQWFAERLVVLLPPVVQSACCGLRGARNCTAVEDVGDVPSESSRPRQCLVPQNIRIGPVFPKHRGVAIAGDCGETRSPTTGIGMSSALSDAVSLVEALGRVPAAVFAAARPVCSSASTTDAREWVVTAAERVNTGVLQHSRSGPVRFAGCTCFGQLLVQAVEGPMCLRDALVRTLVADKRTAVWALRFLSCAYDNSIAEYGACVGHIICFTIYNEIFNRKSGTPGTRAKEFLIAGGMAAFLATRAVCSALASLWWFADPSVWC